MTPRSRLAPYLRGNAWWARVPKLPGDGVRMPLGILGKQNKALAQECCDFLVWLRNRHRAFLLGEIHAKRATIGAAFEAFTANTLDDYERELRDGPSDVNLEPLVAKWQKELERRKKPIASERAKYLRQVRTLIPAGAVFRRSAFTAQCVMEWLDGIDGQSNRWRAALSSFAQYCVTVGAIPSNPVRAVRQIPESEPRTAHLIQLNAKKLLAAIDAPKLRAFHAAMMAGGMEHGAARQLDPATVTEASGFARGTKGHRQRTVRIYGRWTWAWEHVRTFMDGHRDGTQPFGDVTYDASRAALRKGLERAGLPADYTQHDHRHTWAVQAVRDGISDYVIADQLGNSVAMVRRVYGRFRPTEADFPTRKRTGSDTARSAVHEMEDA